MSNIISIILLIVSGAAFFLWINPMYVGDLKNNEKGVKQLLKEKNLIDDKLSKVNKIEKRRKELKREYSKLRSSQSGAIEKLKKMVPDDMENARLINYIQSIKQNSVSTQISDIRIDTGGDEVGQKKGKIVIKKEKNYKSVNLSFSFTSKYTDFVQFLDDLYKSLRVVDITAINISPSDKRDKNLNQDKFKFDIRIRTYWLNK